MAPSAVEIHTVANGQHHNHVSNGHIDGDSYGLPSNGRTNGFANGHSDGSHVPSYNLAPTFSLNRASDDEVQDLLCIGFGPASLAIAVALHDMLEAGLQKNPKIRFLERQTQFAWHAGMLLPGTKMQISFIKDLATLRNPRSKFTFLNYLQEHNRLVHFSNLDTFLPFREEFEDYLRWVATHFENVVDYRQEVLHVRPVKRDGGEKFDCVEVTSRDVKTGEVTTLFGRNVVIAVGGRPSRPAIFPESLDRVIHSSQYKQRISNLLPDSDKPYNIAVVGSGQSAAEVFNDLHSRYPNATTRMIIRDTALRPSDDSPFVNEVFDPDAVDEFYQLPPLVRARVLARNKATNYSVVRLGLIEKIYEELYHQCLHEPNKENWQHQILSTREIVDVNDQPQNKMINMTLKNTNPVARKSRDTLHLDAVVLGTGYVRNVHIDMLQGCQVINGAPDGQWLANRDYQVQIDREFAEERLGIYLQGCNEGTHGLADSLLSVLATRGGELVQALFGKSTGLKASGRQ